MKTLLDKIRKVGSGFKRGVLIVAAVASLGVASCTEQCTPNPINNHSPEITSVPIIQINEGSSYNYDVDATDIDGDTLIYSLPLFPPWLSINSNTGMVSGVAPQVDSDTPFDIEVGVSDGVNSVVTQNYTLTVKNVIGPINHSPEITSTPTTQVNEESSYNYDVDATDIDGDTLIYSLSVAPPWLSINSNTGLISGTTPQVDSDTPFNIEVGVSDGVNSVVPQSYTLTVKNVIGPVEDYLDVEGWLQDNETDTGKQGTIKIYDSLKNSIGETTTDSSGHFVFHSDSKKATDLSQIIIQARSGTYPSWTSYVKTLNASVNSASEPDVTVNPIRVVAYPNFCSNADFKTFMNQINASYTGVRGFDLSQLEGIEIIDVDPLGSGSNFSSTQQDILADKIQDINDIRIYVEGRNLNVQKDSGSLYTKHYSTTSVPDQITPDPGWIIVAPKNIGGGQTSFFWDFDLGKIKRARIDLGVVNDTTPTHEFGHAFIAANPDYNGHSSILLNPLTIMTVDNLKLPPPGVADVKAAHIIYEDTYKTGEGLDDILGTTF